MSLTRRLPRFDLHLVFCDDYCMLPIAGNLHCG